ncbi:MAG: DUF2274 domain-containing protein [Parvularculaceae bacterium]
MSLRLAELPRSHAVETDDPAQPLTSLRRCRIMDIYEATYGKREPIEQLAPEMLETFLNGDAGFKRARKELHQQRKEK